MTRSQSGDDRSIADQAESALRWIGDLNHPFYEDERRRFVWYESTAVGIQVVLTMTYLTAGLTLLVAGSQALPYVIAMMAPLLVGLLAMVWFSRYHRASFSLTGHGVEASRARLIVAVLGVFFLGVVRSFVDLSGSDIGEFRSGWFVGVIVGCLAVGVLLGRKRTTDASADS